MYLARPMPTVCGLKMSISRKLLGGPYASVRSCGFALRRRVSATAASDMVVVPPPPRPVRPARYRSPPHPRIASRGPPAAYIKRQLFMVWGPSADTPPAHRSTVPAECLHKIVVIQGSGPISHGPDSAASWSPHK